MNIIQENIDNNRWVIINMFDHEDGVNFFDIEDGWTFDLSTATFYDLDEIGRFDLPINGAWIPVSRAAYYV